MSLIEAAIRKAKRLAATAPADAPAVEAPVTRRPQREKVRPPTAYVQPGRSFRPTVVDPMAMERSGVMLQVGDAGTERSYKILRTRVQQRLEEAHWHSIAVTGAAPGDGKTITAINLAVALARDVNTWVFLVDLDLQQPQMAAYLGMKFDKGLSDYLAGQAAFEDVIYEPAGIERLAVVPNGKPLEQSSELLGSPRMFEFCQALANEQPRRIVVFDMPPVLLSDDVLRFLPNVDGLLFVVAEGKTPRAAVEHAREVLPDDKLLGVVLNRSAERQESGYY